MILRVAIAVLYPPYLFHTASGGSANYRRAWG